MLTIIYVAVALITVMFTAYGAYDAIKEYRSSEPRERMQEHYDNRYWRERYGKIG